jgi:ribosome biogenesis protein YTM1
VESVAVDHQGRFVASASADGLVKVWTTAAPTDDEPIEETTHTKKKKKTEKVDDRKIKTKAVSLEGHVGGVNAVVFDGLDANIVYTGGWDHSIRSWDVEQQVNLSTKVMFGYSWVAPQFILKNAMYY